MSYSYYQYCILGFGIPASELEIEISPIETEDQPRYDTKTGKISHYETVVIKSGESVYRFQDLEAEHPSELAEEIEIKYPNLIAKYQNGEYGNAMDFLYIGFEVGEQTDVGSINLIDGSLSLRDLSEIENQLIEMFPRYRNEIKLHLFSWIN